MRTLSAALASMALANPALAHMGSGAEGFAHPFQGLDHLTAMVAVGMLVALGGSWRLPAAFLLATATGAALGLAGVWPPGVELGVALSVAVLGLVLLVARPLPGVAAVAMVAVFGLCHGLAHAAAPGAASPAFLAGLVGGTAVLHGVGALAGLGLRRSAWLRATGGAFAGLGLVLLLLA